MKSLSQAAKNVRRRLRSEAAAADAGLYGGFDDQVEGRVREDIRDRAAYVYITGSFPTHLRRNYTAVLRAVTDYFKTPTALDKGSGSFTVKREVIEDLKLEEHPMVQMTRRKIAEGYLIQAARRVVSRRPQSKIFMFHRDDAKDRITVQVDGSVKDNWD